MADSPRSLVSSALRVVVSLTRAARPVRSSRASGEPGLLAILVTDLEDFTGRLESLGDSAARDLMRVHDRLLRCNLVERGGCEVAHTGDGVIAAFRSVSAALCAAAAIQEALAVHSATHPRAALRARVGVHVGEPLAESGRLIGVCINTAVRICAAAGPERVLATELVCQLAAGKPLVFGPKETLVLKGLSSGVVVRELLWRPAAIARRLERPMATVPMTTVARGRAMPKVTS